MDKIQWCIEQHEKTNHLYGDYLPYRFHLEMVSKIAEDFQYLLDDSKEYFSQKSISEFGIRGDNPVTLKEACLIAVWAHDLIEDTRVSYNDVKSHLGQEVADIVYALTNDKGKNRKERAGEKYYEGIRNTSGAVFVKLCDRIANVSFSKMMGSRMYKVYEKENQEFVESLGYTSDHEYSKMFEYLNSLFVSTKEKKEKVSGNQKEKDLEIYDLWESKSGNLFLKVSDDYSIAIGPKGDHNPNEDDLTKSQYVKSDSISQVKKVGKLKFK